MSRFQDNENENENDNDHLTVKVCDNFAIDIVAFMNMFVLIVIYYSFAFWVFTGDQCWGDSFVYQMPVVSAICAAAWLHNFSSLQLSLVIFMKSMFGCPCSKFFYGALVLRIVYEKFDNIAFVSTGTRHHLGYVFKTHLQEYFRREHDD